MKTNPPQAGFSAGYSTGTPADSYAAGMRAALPVVIGYLPAGFAWGAAAGAIGLDWVEAGAMSAIVLSGANQVFLLAAIPAAMPALLIVGIAAFASLRHVLYGLALRPRIGGSLPQRLLFAFGLTDEAFATTLAQGRQAPPGGRWLIGLALSVWAAWTAGSLAGALAGDALRQSSESAAEAMGFALPALFLSLVMASARRAVLAPMLLAALIAAGLLLAGQPALAIPAGALACLLAQRRREP